MQAAGALVLYLLLVAWLTWPLAGQLGTHLPAPSIGSHFDALWTTWALAHETVALSTDPASLLDGNVFHPDARSLFYGPTAFGALPVFAPVFLLTGNPALAINATFLGCTALTAWTLHLVTRRWTGSTAAAFVAAWTFLTSRFVLWELAPTAPQYAVLQWFAPIVLLAATPLERRTERAALGAAIVLQCLADLVYVAPAVLAPLALLAGGRLLRRETRGAGRRLAGVLAVASLLLVPVYAGYVDVYLRNPALSAQTTWRHEAFVIPFGGLPLLVGPTVVPSVALLLIAIGAVLEPRGWWSSRAWRAAAVWTVVGCLLSLPPRTPGWEWPHAWVAERLPIYVFLRVPERLGVAGLIGLALLAGLGFAACARRVSALRSGRAGVAALTAIAGALMYAGYVTGYDPLHPRPPLPAAYPTTPAIAEDEPLAEALAASRAPLLELPVDRLEQQARAMYRSIFHRRPVLNGYTSYEPAGFAERMALAKALPAPAAVAALRRETGLGAVLVHAGPGNRKRRTWLALAERGRADLQLVARDGDSLLFAVGVAPE